MQELKTQSAMLVAGIRDIGLLLKQKTNELIANAAGQKHYFESALREVMQRQSVTLSADCEPPLFDR